MSEIKNNHGYGNLSQPLGNTTGTYSIDNPYLINGGSTVSAITGANGYSHANWTTLSPTMTMAPSGTISLQGENADIKINGVSLTDTLNTIGERLNILRPNSELEAEWHQLKALGDQYRELEKQLKEKSEMWNTLKAMPPKID
jgi:hypothetical protein